MLAKHSVHDSKPTSTRACQTMSTGPLAEPLLPRESGALFAGQRPEVVIKEALDQRDRSIEQIKELHDALRRSESTREHLELALDDRQDRIDELLRVVDSQTNVTSKMKRGWKSVSTKMIDQISTLKQEVEDAKQSAEARPSQIFEALQANPENQTVRTMNVLASKDKELETMTIVIDTFQDFVSRVASLGADASKLDIAALIEDAQQTLAVSVS
jgi:chromosome segregation ATPase